MTEATTVGRAVSEAERLLAHAGIPSPRIEAEVMLARRLGVERVALLLRRDDPVPMQALEAFTNDVARRSSRYPLQYITGVQEFYSLEFEVNEHVLVPRPETEMIVDEVLRLWRRSRPGGLRAAAPSADPRAGAVSPDPRADAFADPPAGAEWKGRTGPVIVDVGTGSGCIAVTLAVNLGDCRIVAIDISDEALAVAKRNAILHGAERAICFMHGDGLRPALNAGLAGGIDVVVSNPPYIAEEDLAGLQPELRHEPRIALTPGSDGLAFTARMIREAGDALGTGGWLLIELSAGAAERARHLLDSALWEDVDVKADVQGIPRLLIARRRGA